MTTSARRRTAAAVSGAALGLVLTACSGGTTAATGDRSGDEPTTTDSSGNVAGTTAPTESDPPTTSAPPSETAAPGPDPVCGGLGLDVVRQVLGPTMKSYLAEVDYCVYAGPRHRPPTLIVTAVPTIGDPAEFAREAKDFCESGFVEVDGVGDHAWTCDGPTFGPQGYVVAGEAFVELDLASGDDEADLASLLELLTFVEVPAGLEFPE